MDYTASSYEMKRFMSMMDWWEGLLPEDFEEPEDIEFDEEGSLLDIVSIKPPSPSF